MQCSNGFLRQSIIFNAGATGLNLGLLQTSCDEVSIPVNAGRPQLVFSDRDNFEVKALLKACIGKNIPSLTIKLYDKKTLKNTYTYTNVQLVPVCSKVSDSNCVSVNYVVDIVAESKTSTYDW